MPKRKRNGENSLSEVPEIDSSNLIDNFDPFRGIPI